MTTLSVVQDRVCQVQNKTIQLSAQEVINCDKSNYQCNGGYVNRVLSWGKRKGFIPEYCLPYEAKKGNCTEEDLQNNPCRQNNQVYKILDFCLAQDETGIKKEILKNGPLVAQMTVYTDFLTYKEGLYHRTEDSFRFNGQHIVKIVGWDKNPDGGDYWLVENVWGSDWGENGYVKILTQDKSTQIDFYAIGLAVYPITMAEYYQMQEEQMKAAQSKGTEDEAETIDGDAEQKEE